MQRKGFKKREYDVSLGNGRVIKISAKSLCRAKKLLSRNNKYNPKSYDNLTSNQLQEIRITIDEYNRTHKTL